jgi:hypothetical protein
MADLARHERQNTAYRRRRPLILRIPAIRPSAAPHVLTFLVQDSDAPSELPLSHLPRNGPTSGNLEVVPGCATRAVVENHCEIGAILLIQQRWYLRDFSECALLT